ncbi:MAG TPA: 4Fe-4S double cluster binding domain-containing protein [Spirochaetota bacterium]|nr:4Fe-4S double cluster binding domain-containing protein [Spirochaetota bacterium]HPL18123.1 4Fe-4S double cluster binding domain-containing protein [Spirochaetota bacterium]HQF09180.1 4Fe-4S double cluster binding domain-containing protein [Spirochaetota bacterium]HQH97722.1 4Fe-4S double cluster binding domain-containing protein [Spirochaetota bacterium]HQJ71424.1 4Fe-4S double cluster binding domain-containing protein [Spirochaetota bacterium]
MITEKEIIDKALEIGFADAGFTTAEPFESHREFLRERREEYGWAEKAGLALMDGTDPKTVLPGAQSIIVLLDCYCRESFPRFLEGNFGRCYLDDDRITKDGLALRIKSFRSYLRDNGIDSKVPFNLPHRVAAARAGMGTFGKNCLFYAGRAARQSSWVLPITVVVDRAFAPGKPTVRMGCPDWCRNACIAACPTRALKGNGTIDPRKCISYMTYFGKEITPRELREPMGMYVYGCDVCQNVCPRNRPWLSQELPANRRVEAKASNFDIRALLRMDRDYFTARVWPHMFYMSPDDIWKWKMNVARVMGNSLDESYVPDLERAFSENEDERVLGMIAWALGRIGGGPAMNALEAFHAKSEGMVREEIEAALGNGRAV